MNLPDSRDEDSVESPAYTEVSRLSMDGGTVLQVDAGLRVPGCAYRRRFQEQHDGLTPCYNYCVWPTMASDSLGDTPFTPERFIDQVESLRRQINGENAQREAEDSPLRIQAANLYTAGSSFNEDEIPFATILDGIRQVGSIDSVKRVLIEARATDIKDEQLDALQELAAELGINVAISLGVETTNQKILKLALKGSSEASTKKALQSILEHPNLTPQAFLLIKPTVMTEKAALLQALKDIAYFAELSREFFGEEKPSKKIQLNMSPVFPIPGTGADINDAYKPTSYWAVFEILKNLRDLTLAGDDIMDRIEIKFNVNDEGTDAAMDVMPCNDCSVELLAALREFNATQNLDVINSVPSCHCRDEWKDEVDSDSIPFGTINYPYQPDNNIARTVYEMQMRGIMEVEHAAFPEGSRATRDQMDQRIAATGGGIQTIAYHPETGEIIGCHIVRKIEMDELQKLIDAGDVGWEALNNMPHSDSGTIVRGISIGARPNAPKGTARAVFIHNMFDLVEELGLQGSTGCTRLPGLRDCKLDIEKQLGFELTPEELQDLAEKYVAAHMVILDEERATGEFTAKAVSFNFECRGDAAHREQPLDGNLRFHGRLPYTHFGPVVPNAMSDDDESCTYGMFVMYEGKKWRAQNGLRDATGIDVPDSVHRTEESLSVTWDEL